MLKTGEKKEEGELADEISIEIHRSPESGPLKVDIADPVKMKMKITMNYNYMKRLYYCREKVPLCPTLGKKANTTL